MKETPYDRRKRLKRKIAVDQAGREQCRALGISPFNWYMYGAYERNGHIIKRDRKQLYYKFIERAESTTRQVAGTKEQRLEKIKQAKEYLNVAITLRKGDNNGYAT